MSRDAPQAAPEPCVRMRHMRAFLDAIDALPEAARARVRAAAGIETFEPFDTHTAGEWVPTEWNVRWVHAVHAALGDAGFARFFRDLTRRDFDTSLYKSFVAGVLRLFGNKPSAIVRRIPAGYSMMWRDSGALTLTREWDGGATLVLRPLPACCLDPIWTDSVRWGLQGIFDVLELRGATACELDRPEHAAIYMLSWQS